MQWAVLFWIAAALACAQTTVSTSVYDGMGDRIPGPHIVQRGDTLTVTTQSLNGRSIPQEQVQERVVRSDGSLQVIERVVKRYDQTGHLSQTDRIVEERSTAPDGTTTVRSNTSRTDISGNFQPFERSVTEQRKAGATLTTESVLERAGMDGAFQPVEKQVTVADKSPSHEVENTATYHRDGNGQFYEAVKDTVDRQLTPGTKVENAARYVASPAGQLQLVSQRVKSETARGGGSASIVVDVYSADTPLSTGTYGDPVMKLKEQQLIERNVAAGSVTDVVSVRRPSLSDPNRLGPAQKISETVCRGKCDGGPVAP